jgi:hypothetical protein
MECVVYKRRIFLGGIASATILASSVLTAGTALAARTPKFPPPPSATSRSLPLSAPISGSSLIPSGPAAGALGVISTLLAAPAAISLIGATPAGWAASDATGAIPAVSGITGAAQGLTKPGGATVPGVTSRTGNALPAAGNIPSLGNVSNITGNLGSATSEIPALGGVAGAVNQATKLLGGS